MIGRTPAHLWATRPLRHGVIADFEVTEQMLRHFMAKVLESRRARPRLVVCAPSGITEVERRAVEEAARRTSPPRSAAVHRAARAAGCSKAQAFAHNVQSIVKLTDAP
jgi:actin-like ATPase involved in cell morphogenesis